MPVISNASSSELFNENSTLYTNEKSSYLTDSAACSMIVQSFYRMSNCVTAVFRSLFHKMALILFTL